jgi:hypothetical protein
MSSKYLLGLSRLSIFPATFEPFLISNRLQLRRTRLVALSLPDFLHAEMLRIREDLKSRLLIQVASLLSQQTSDPDFSPTHKTGSAVSTLPRILRPDGVDASFDERGCVQPFGTTHTATPPRDAAFGKSFPADTARVQPLLCDVGKCRCGFP